MILFQRALYDPDSFDVVKKYGLSLYITNDEGLSTYLKCVLKQLAEWLALGQVKKVVIVIAEVESKEVMERWTFNIECDKEAFEAKEAREKDIKEIHKEIAALMRQITGAITFLPLLDKPCSFDILIYTHSDVEVPGEVRMLIASCCICSISLAVLLIVGLVCLADPYTHVLSVPSFCALFV